MKCSNCEAELISNSIFCNQCGIKILHEDWVQLICSDKKFWHERAFDEYPSIIAHEYWRVYSLIKENKTYGALIKIKDLLEVLIKFPVIIGIAQIYNKKNKTKQDIEVLAMVVEKVLALGDWRSISNKVEKCLINSPLKRIINGINEIYNNQNIFQKQRKVDIVQWRNETIGHGSLAFDCDQEFQMEFRGLLSTITEYIRNYEHEYKYLKMFVRNDVKSKELKGKNVQSCIIDGTVFIEIEDKETIPMYPFMIFNSSELFIYNAYIRKKNKYDMLCYRTGKKIHPLEKTIINQLEEINEKYLKAIVRNELDLIHDESPENEDYLINYEDCLWETNDNKRIQKVDYLNEWISSKIFGESANNKGIFLLKMEQGMGKTTWIRTLDSRINRNSELKNITCKIIYLNSTYNAKTKQILSAIEDVITLDENHCKIYRDENNVHLNYKSDDKKRELVNFIKYYKQLFSKNGRSEWNEKVLIILDGLDEILWDNNNDFYDWIPEEKELCEGIYILLTCRTDEELSESKKQGICKIKVAEEDRLNVYNEDVRNVEILKEYLYNELQEIEEKQKNIILQESLYRFIYLKIYILVLKKQSNNIFYSFNSKNIIDKYISMISDEYGFLENNQIGKLIYMLAYYKKPLTIKELSELLGEDKISFRLLGYLNDIRALIIINRVGIIQRIELANEVIRDIAETKLLNYRNEIQDNNRFVLEQNVLCFKDDIMKGYIPNAISYLWCNYSDYDFFDVEELKRILTNKYVRLIKKIAENNMEQEDYCIIENGYEILKQMRDALEMVANAGGNFDNYVVNNILNLNQSLLHRHQALRRDILPEERDDIVTQIAVLDFLIDAYKDKLRNFSENEVEYKEIILSVNTLYGMKAQCEQYLSKYFNKIGAEWQAEEHLLEALKYAKMITNRQEYSIIVDVYHSLIDIQINNKNIIKAKQYRKEVKGYEDQLPCGDIYRNPIYLDNKLYKVIGLQQEAHILKLEQNRNSEKTILIQISNFIDEINEMKLIVSDKNIILKIHDCMYMLYEIYDDLADLCGNNIEEKEKYYLQAKSIIEELIKVNFPVRLNKVLDIYIFIASFQRKIGKYEDSIRTLEEILNITQKNPNIGEYEETIVNMYGELGYCYFNKSSPDYFKAYDYYEKSILYLKNINNKEKLEGAYQSLFFNSRCCCMVTNNSNAKQEYMKKSSFWLDKCDKDFKDNLAYKFIEVGDNNESASCLMGKVTNKVKFFEKNNILHYEMHFERKECNICCNKECRGYIKNGKVKMGMLRQNY